MNAESALHFHTESKLVADCQRAPLCLPAAAGCKYFAQAHEMHSQMWSAPHGASAISMNVMRLPLLPAALQSLLQESAVPGVIDASKAIDIGARMPRN